MSFLWVRSLYLLCSVSSLPSATQESGIIAPLPKSAKYIFYVLLQSQCAVKCFNYTYASGLSQSAESVVLFKEYYIYVYYHIRNTFLFLE